MADNYVEGSPDATADNWLGVDGNSFKKMSAPWDAMPIRQQSPKDAYLAVLQQAGCSLPRRDSIDARIIEEVKSGTATHGNSGIIDKPDDVGGWPTLQSAEAPQDSDNNGMPDAWERKYGLDANHADDNSADKDGDGYTNVEEYLNLPTRPSSLTTRSRKITSILWRIPVRTNSYRFIAMRPLLVLLATTMLGGHSTLTAADKPRVIATSDGEIDDECSMVRFRLYANDFDVEGIVTSSSKYHWQGHRWAGDDWIEPYLNAYAEVYRNLVCEKLPRSQPLAGGDAGPRPGLGGEARGQGPAERQRHRRS